MKADGSYSFADTPTAGGTVTYKVAYAGDAAHTAVSASEKVAVSRTATTLSRTVQIWSNPYGGDKPNKLLKTGKVDSSGNIAVAIAMTRSAEVTAVFAGDARSASRTVGARAYADVRISSAMTYYKGRSERLDLQVYSAGRWYASDAVHVSGSSGDNANATTYGAWKYLYFTS